MLILNEQIFAARDRYRAHLLSVRDDVVDIAGELVQTPSNGSILYEAVRSSIPLPPHQLDPLVAFCAIVQSGHRDQSWRVMSPVPHGTTYDAHLIEKSATWPEHRPTRSDSRIQSSYNRIRRDASVMTVTFESLSDTEIRAQLDAILLDPRLDALTPYAWLEYVCRGGDVSAFDWVKMAADGEPYAVFLTSKTPDTLRSHFISLVGEAKASIATWHIINNSDLPYFDMWNVGLSDRERYKWAFFTGTTQGHCWFAGPNPYFWLHTKEHQ